MIAALAFTSSAFAGIHLSVRSDYINNPTYKDANDSDVNGTSEFIGSYARLFGTGKVGDADFKSAFDLRKATNIFSSTGTGAGVMTVDNFVHYFYVDKPLVEGLRVQVGKLEVNQGGWEYDTIENGDSYLDSLANGGAAGYTLSKGAAAGDFVANPGYYSGVGLSYNFMDTNTVTFQVLNQTNQTQGTYTGVPATPGTVTSSSNKRQSMDLAYTGWFLNKTLGVKASYLWGAADTQAINLATGAYGASTHVNENYLAVGVKYVWENLDATLDYLTNQSKADGAEKDITTSEVLGVSYKLNAWKPFIKYEHSENKLANATDTLTTSGYSFKRDAYTVGVEWMATEAIRLNAALSQVNDKPGSATLTHNPSWQQYLVGIKYDTDLLK